MICMFCKKISTLYSPIRNTNLLSYWRFKTNESWILESKFSKKFLMFEKKRSLFTSKQYIKKKGAGFTTVCVKIQQTWPEQDPNLNSFVLYKSCVFLTKSYDLNELFRKINIIRKPLNWYLKVFPLEFQKLTQWKS